MSNDGERPHDSGAAGSDRPAGGTLDWRTLHLWQIQPVRDVLLGLAILLLLWLGQKVSIVTVPILLAMLLAYLLEPVIAWLIRRTGWKRQGAVSAIIGAFVLLVAIPSIVGTIFGVGQLVVFAAETVDNIALVDASADPSLEGDKLVEARERLRQESGAGWVWIRDKVAEARAEDSSLSMAFSTIRDWAARNAEDIAASAAGVGLDAMRRAASFFGSVFALLFMGFLTAFFFYFISTGWQGVKDFLTSLIPDKEKGTVLSLAGKFDNVISAFIRGRLTIAFIQAVVFTIGYFIIGVPAAFILGPIVALLSIVPYMALVGVPISIGLLWLESHTGVRGQWWWVVGLPVGFYFFAQALDDYVWTPMIQGKETGMSTPAILAASLAGGVLFGVFGLLIAIPIAACLKIAMEELFWPRFHAWAEGRSKDFLPLER
ncbi:MAG: AI-2E family transporter [Phycisphaerales bacterium]|jgi:predicted PurR-regulated permease PerM|nr:AI-2E family transporter [Phycisphaerales bacterium]